MPRSITRPKKSPHRVKQKVAKPKSQKSSNEKQLPKRAQLLRDIANLKSFSQKLASQLPVDCWAFQP